MIVMTKTTTSTATTDLLSLLLPFDLLLSLLLPFDFCQQRDHKFPETPGSLRTAYPEQHAFPCRLRLTVGSSALIHTHAHANSHSQFILLSPEQVSRSLSDGVPHDPSPMAEWYAPTWNGAPHVPAPMADNAQRTLYTTLEFSRGL